ncbi:MAG: radical SAM protein [Candidatus Eremiobacterota bacterium]
MDYVFTVPVSDKYVMHSPLHNITALMNRSAVESLKEGNLKKKDLYELYRSLSEKPACMPEPHRGPVNPDFLGLIPTRSCNFNCLYCGFGSSKDTSVMDFSLAILCVDWMADHVIKQNRKEVEIHFFGGEPFFAPDVIRVAVYRTNMVCATYNVKPVFKVSTNGFFDENTCSFIGDYFDTVVLSLDGPEDIQNRYRPLKKGGNTSHTVERNAFLLGRSPAELCIRVCVTDETVERMEEIAHRICRICKPSSIDFEVLKQTESTYLRPPDPWKFAVNYIKAATVARTSGVTTVYGPASTCTLQHSFCPAGKDTIIVSPEGTISACYLQKEEWEKKGLDLTFGHIDNSGIHINEDNLKSIRHLTDEKKLCRKCIARFHCAGGCHVHHNTEEYDDFCIQTRIITVCNLLYDLGYTGLMEDFINNRKELEKMVFQASDLIGES